MVEPCLKMSPLHFAAEEEYNGNLIEVLIKAGAKVNAEDQESATPLHVAAELGFWPCLEVLISRGADVNCRDCKQLTPLNYIGWGGYSYCVSFLLDAGADVNSQDKDGYTPLLLAAVQIFDGCVETLVEAGADVNIAILQRNFDRTKAEMIKSVQLLLKSGAFINKTNKFGQNALAVHIATQ